MNQSKLNEEVKKFNLATHSNTEEFTRSLSFIKNADLRAKLQTLKGPWNMASRADLVVDDLPRLLKEMELGDVQDLLHHFIRHTLTGISSTLILAEE